MTTLSAALARAAPDTDAYFASSSALVYFERGSISPGMASGSIASESTG